MGRIYSNYDDKEMDRIKEVADELGFSASSFQKYCVMLYIGDRNNNVPIINLQNEMIGKLTTMEQDTTFIVSALLPEKWPSLSRSEKMQLAKFLSSYVKKHAKEYEKHSAVSGKTTKYKKKKLCNS